MPTVRLRSIARGLDVGLLTVTLILVMVGLAALFSFSINIPNPNYSLLIKQALFAAIGFGLAAALIRFDYRVLAGMHWVLYGLSVVMLLTVLVFGKTIRGTTGWFEIAGLQLQPVEFVKITLAVFLARYLSDHAERLQHWSGVAISAAWIALPVGLVMLQPDLGSALILIAMWLGLLFVMPVPRRYFLVIVGGLAAISIFSWFVVLQPYQKERVLNFVSPTRDEQGGGYNVRQAVTAIGSGQWFGRGLGLGPQSQLNFLPERQTDFIFASIGEELGFVGGSFILLMFALFFWRLRNLMLHARDNFSVLLVVAVAMAFFFQVLINIGMNMGMLPVTGIPLPFLSYGGSSMLASLMAVGILESMSVRQRIRL